MPTCNRRAFVPRSIELFLGQDHEDVELLILDDGDDVVLDCVPLHPRIRYIRHTPRLALGAKRNILCREASGDFIAHWDDDDWYPASRIRVQLAALMKSDADLCGSRSIYFRELFSGRCWLFETPQSEGRLAGSSLMYRRTLWQRSCFEDINVGEDTCFVSNVPYEKKIDLADPNLCVAALHSKNTAKRLIGGRAWTAVPSSKVPPF